MTLPEAVSPKYVGGAFPRHAAPKAVLLSEELRVQLVQNGLPQIAVILDEGRPLGFNLHIGRHHHAGDFVGIGNF